MSGRSRPSAPVGGAPAARSRSARPCPPSRPPGAAASRPTGHGWPASAGPSPGCASRTAACPGTAVSCPDLLAQPGVGLLALELEQPQPLLVAAELVAQRGEQLLDGLACAGRGRPAPPAGPGPGGRRPAPGTGRCSARAPWRDSSANSPPPAARRTSSVAACRSSAAAALVVEEACSDASLGPGRRRAPRRAASRSAATAGPRPAPTTATGHGDATAAARRRCRRTRPTIEADDHGILRLLRGCTRASVTPGCDARRGTVRRAPVAARPAGSVDVVVRKGTADAVPARGPRPSRRGGRRRETAHARARPADAAARRRPRAAAGLRRPTELIEDFRLACLSRALDDREILLQKQSRVFFQISGAGHEILLLALARSLRPAYDWFFPYYRDRALVLALGVTPLDILLQAVGSSDDPASGGRQMPCHWGDVGAQHRHPVEPDRQPVPARGGVRRGRPLHRPAPGLPGCAAHGDEITYVSLGEGATSEGEFWESLNTACRLHLPVALRRGRQRLRHLGARRRPVPGAGLRAGARVPGPGRDHRSTAGTTPPCRDQGGPGRRPGARRRGARAHPRPRHPSRTRTRRPTPRPSTATPASWPEEQAHDPIDTFERELVERRRAHRRPGRRASGPRRKRPWPRGGRGGPGRARARPGHRHRQRGARCPSAARRRGPTRPPEPDGRAGAVSWPRPSA